MRKVMIATPSHDGRLDVFYVNALLQSILLCAQKDVQLTPIWISFDALIERARNDLLQIAVDGGFDDVIWIDSDMEWNPEWIVKLLSYDVDVVGGVCRKKTDDVEDYNVKAKDGHIKVLTSGLVEVESVGTGFLRMSRKAFTKLHASSTKYESGGKAARMAFELALDRGELVSEDTNVCRKLSRLRFKTYIDPAMTCNHSGVKKFSGNFAAFVQRVAKAKG